MAEKAPVPSPAPPTRPKLSGFEVLDARVKELTSLQGELLGKIQSLKLEVQKWRANIQAQVKTCQNELLEVKQGLSYEVQQLKSDIKEIRFAIQEEKGNLRTPLRNGEEVSTPFGS